MKKTFEKVCKNVCKTYVNVPKYERMLTKGVCFNVYLAFVTIYMQWMIKDLICGETYHTQAMLPGDMNLHKQTQPDTISRAFFLSS